MELFGNIIGWIAAVLTAFFLIPQTISIIKFKSAKDLSLLMVIIIEISCIAWLIYAIYVKSYQIMFTNIFAGSSCLFILIYKIYQFFRDNRIEFNLSRNKYIYKSKNINEMSLNELIKIKKELSKKKCKKGCSL